MRLFLKVLLKIVLIAVLIVLLMILAPIILWGIGMCFLLINIHVDTGWWFYDKDERVFLERLQKEVTQGADEIRLHALTDFEWDTVCAVSAYEKIDESVEKGLQRTIPELRSYAYTVNEQDWALVFISGDRLQSVMELNSRYGHVRGHTGKCGTGDKVALLVVGAYVAVPQGDMPLREKAKKMPPCGKRTREKEGCGYLLADE